MSISLTSILHDRETCSRDIWKLCARSIQAAITRGRVAKGRTMTDVHAFDEFRKKRNGKRRRKKRKEQRASTDARYSVRKLASRKIRVRSRHRFANGATADALSLADIGVTHLLLVNVVEKVSSSTRTGNVGTYRNGLIGRRSADKVRYGQ